MKDDKGDKKRQVIEQQIAPPAEVFDALREGIPVVTGYKRLATVTFQTFEQAMVDEGQQVWPTPRIWTWSDWLQDVWEQAVVAGSVPASEFLLTSQQELRIWEDIITESMGREPVQQLTGMAHEVQQAWQQIRSWHIPLNRDRFLYNRDSTAFFTWATRFKARCANQHWLPDIDLAERLLQSLQVEKLEVPGELVLIGFDVLTPQQDSLLSTLAEHGCRVRWIVHPSRAGRAGRAVYPDAREEVEGMARWVRGQLEANPDARIGVVVPEFVEQRDIVVQALDEILTPGAACPGQASVPRPYNLSLGLPLSVYPVVSAALQLLELQKPAVNLDTAGRLLRSPFISGWGSEAGSRALLDVRLRKAREPEVTLGTVRYLASQTEQPWSCPLLARRLGRWVEVAQQVFREPASAGQWSERFSGLLEAIGWTEGRPLSSEEYQSVQAWRKLLVDFASLEPVTGPMRLGTALSKLGAMARERLFQPQTTVVPVQVQNVNLASWLQFDCLWIMGLHDGVWPPSPRPNPFIPLPVQRDAGLPESSESLALQSARTMTARLLSGADEVVVSSPFKKGEEVLRPSPLVTHLPVTDTNSVPGWDAPIWRDQVHESADLMELRDDPVPPLIEGEPIGGGSAVFKLQAACPFRAFAELRLSARAIPQAEIGLDAMARGALVHRILEKVWDELGSSKQLMATDSVQLQTLVTDIVDNAIREAARRRLRTFTKRFREMEAERLVRQVLEWLEQEKQREPFRVIECEARYKATVAGLPVRLRIDRMDELKDGRRVVIDYKTGQVSANQWFGERPDEPQMPLYSLAVDREIAGLAFAQFRAGSMAFKGVVEDEDLMGKVPAWYKLRQTRTAGSWSSVLLDWRATMETLAGAFCKGEAAVDPKHFPQTCRYCDLGSLCRIDEIETLRSRSMAGESSDV